MPDLTVSEIQKRQSQLNIDLTNALHVIFNDFTKDTGMVPYVSINVEDVRDLGAADPVTVEISTEITL